MTSGRTVAFALSALGTLLFWWAGLPLPFLFGPMFACLLAALAGIPMSGPGKLALAARPVIGVSIGTAVTPGLIAALPDMALSLCLVPFYIAVIGLTGMPFFRYFFRFDPATAWYASMPGGLADMVIFGQEAGGDPRALSLVHATRVLVILTVAPLVMTIGFGENLDRQPGESLLSIPPGQIALMVAAALIGWGLGERAGLFGAAILGPLIASGTLTVLGLIHHKPPFEIVLAAQFLIGMVVGSGFVGVTMGELVRVVFAGTMFVLFLAVLAVGFTWIVVQLGLAGPIDALLAFAPGGQAEMLILAIVAGADLGYVVVHHLARVLLVIFGAPVAARIIGATNKRD
nr:AbrB family transcriptional regulator [Pseudoruegeria sp. HB172150]